MNGPFLKTDRSSRPGYAGSNRFLDTLRVARRRNVESLFEKGAVERVGFVEQGQNAKLSSGQQALQGKLNPGDKVLDHDLVGGLGPTHSDFRIRQNRQDSFPGRNE